ncbi:hypothetical protein [Actinocrinis puniceicyclus]|nr:hypothetical protein [Actinocrinis puniceicyclus]
MATAVLGPIAAIAAAAVLTACSADDPAHRSFRPQVITASGIPYTGNGIAALDPQAIMATTVKATSSAPTVHLTGSLSGVPVPSAPATDSARSRYEATGSGSNADGSSSTAVPFSAGKFTVDMVFTQFGAVGDITSGSVTSRLLRVEDEVWTAEPASFWKEIGAIDNGNAYGGLYVRIPAADPRYGGFSEDTRIGYLLDHLLLTSTTWAKGPVGTVNGENALELDGIGHNGHKASIWVATDGRPYILRIAPTAGSYRGRIDFTDYEDRVAVQAPLPGQVLGNALLVVPSASPSATPSAQPTATGPARPTATVTGSPQVDVSASASASSSASPSASDTLSPSASPSPSASQTGRAGPH